MNQRDALDPRDEERLARYLAGDLPGVERGTFERDALADDALAEALYQDAQFQALAVPGTAAPTRETLLPRRTAPYMRVALPLAASIAVVAGVAWWIAIRPAQGPIEDLVRGASPGVTLIEPRGEINAPPERLVWTRDPVADAYRVELFDAEGRLVLTLLTADTTASLVGHAQAPPAAGEWRVTPIDADGAERPAPPAGRYRLRRR